MTWLTGGSPKASSAGSRSPAAAASPASRQPPAEEAATSPFVDVPQDGRRALRRYRESRRAASPEAQAAVRAFQRGAGSFLIPDLAKEHTGSSGAGAKGASGLARETSVEGATSKCCAPEQRRYYVTAAILVLGLCVLMLSRSSTREVLAQVVERVHSSTLPAGVGVDGGTLRGSVHQEPGGSTHDEEAPPRSELPEEAPPRSELPEEAKGDAAAHAALVAPATTTSTSTSLGSSTVTSTTTAAFGKSALAQGHQAALTVERTSPEVKQQREDEALEKRKKALDALVGSMQGQAAKETLHPAQGANETTHLVSSARKPKAREEKTQEEPEAVAKRHAEHGQHEEHRAQTQGDPSPPSQPPGPAEATNNASGAGGTAAAEAEAGPTFARQRQHAAKAKATKALAGKGYSHGLQGSKARNGGHGYCRTAAVGEECFKQTVWAMNVGIHVNPDWFPDLTAASSFTDFQRHLAKGNTYKCDRPCDEPCLCLYDAEGTLASRPDQKQACANGTVIAGVQDPASTKGAELVISEIGQQLSGTFCHQCYRGIVASSEVGGPESEMRVILLTMLGGEEATVGGKWSEANNISSLLVSSARDGHKHETVRNMLAWFQAQHGVIIDDARVHFFDDEKRNVKPFAQTRWNARQVSCDSRTEDRAMGVCGGSLAEAAPHVGTFLCSEEVDLKFKKKQK